MAVGNGRIPTNVSPKCRGSLAVSPFNPFAVVVAAAAAVFVAATAAATTTVVVVFVFSRVISFVFGIAESDVPEKSLGGARILESHLERYRVRI